MFTMLHIENCDMQGGDWVWLVDRRLGTFVRSSQCLGRPRSLFEEPSAEEQLSELYVSRFRFEVHWAAFKRWGNLSGRRPKVSRSCSST